MADIPPDFIPEDPDGHRWVTPKNPDCPNCQCCTDFLCSQAREQRCSCDALVGRGAGVMDVSLCPCAPISPAQQELRATIKRMREAERG